MSNYNNNNYYYYYYLSQYSTEKKHVFKLDKILVINSYPVSKFLETRASKQSILLLSFKSTPLVQ